MAYPVIPDVPVAGGSVAVTMQNAANANGNGTVLPLLATASIIFTVTFAAFTGTVNFEVTEDGVNWDPLQVTQEGTNTILTSLTGSTTTFVHLYEGSVAGLLQARARISNYSAGTATVTAHAVATTDAPRVTNVNLVNSGTPAIVQKAANVSASNVQTLAKAFASNNFVGNTIIVVCGAGNNGALSVTDTQSNTYTQAKLQANSTTFEAAIFFATNIVGGANTVTVTNAGAAASMAMEIYEVSGLLAQIPAQPDNSTSGTGTSTAVSLSNLAASVPNALAFLGVAVGTAAQAVSVTSGTTWTLDSTQNSGGTPTGLFTFGSLSQPLGNLTAVTPQATLAGSEPFAAVAAIFRPVAVGVSGTVQIGGYNYTNITSATTTVVKTGPGVLHIIAVNTDVASATITVYDNTAASGTKIGTLTCQASTVGEPKSVTYDAAFLTGLTLVTSGATDVTVTWK